MLFIDWERNGRVVILIIFNNYFSFLCKYLFVLEVIVS